jgi:hypothetical protein
LREPLREFPVHDGYRAALLLARDDRVLGLIHDRNLHSGRIVTGGFSYCERHKTGASAIPVPDRDRGRLLPCGLVSVARASREFPRRADDRLRMIALDVVTAIGHADVLGPREIRGDLILHVDG